MHERLEERPRGQHDRSGAVLDLTPATYAGDPARLDLDRLDHLLAEREVLLALDGELGQKLVGFLVALGTRTMHRRPLASVEQAELDRRGVGKDSHRAAQGIDLADDLTLGHAANRRITAHLAHCVAIQGEQGGAQAHPGCRQRRFEPGMPGSYHDDVKSIRVLLPRHGPLDSRPGRGKEDVEPGRADRIRAPPQLEGPGFIHLIETSSRPNRGTGTVPRKPRLQLV